MKKLLLALGVVALLAGCCCSSGGGMGGTADEYGYHNGTVEYTTWDSNGHFNNNATHGTGTATARNSGIVYGD